MTRSEMVDTCFNKWETGNFLDLPVSENFVHISPYGTIKGKQKYMDLVEANKKQFLGHRFRILDEIYEKDKACVRYLAIKPDFEMEVSEWFYFGEHSIDKIIAYYNIDGKINEDRQLTNPEPYGD